MNRLETERLKQEITKSELARRSGVNQVTTIDVCNGRRVVGPATLQKLADGIGWSGDLAELLVEVPDDARD